MPARSPRERSTLGFIRALAALLYLHTSLGVDDDIAVLVSCHGAGIRIQPYTDRRGNASRRRDHRRIQMPGIILKRNKYFVRRDCFLGQIFNTHRPTDRDIGVLDLCRSCRSTIVCELPVDNRHGISVLAIAKDHLDIRIVLRGLQLLVRIERLLSLGQLAPGRVLNNAGHAIFSSIRTVNIDTRNDIG